MTITSTPRTSEPSSGTTAAGARSLSAAEQARRRRARRNAKIAAAHGADPTLVRPKLSSGRVPFVALLVALLGAGLAGVLWLNTLTDEAGIRANAAKNAAATARLKIEDLTSDIAAKNATPAIAEAARALGLIPAGDAAILMVPADGGAATVIGTPTPVVDPKVVAAEAAAAAAAAAQAAAQAAADQAAADQAAVQAAQAAADQAAAAAAAAAAAPPPADTATTTAGAAG